MKDGSRGEHVIGDRSHIEVGIGAAFGEHRALVTIDDDDDRARRLGRIAGQPCIHARIYEILGVALDVGCSHPADEVDARPEGSQPHRGVRGRTARAVTDRRRRIGVVAHGDLRHHHDVVDHITYDDDASGYCHLSAPCSACYVHTRPWRSRPRAARCRGQGRD